MSEKECSHVAHNHVVERLDRNERRLNNHSERIDKLEQTQTGLSAQMSALTKSIDKLDGTLRWLIGLGAATFIGFFIKAVERGLFQ